MRARYDTFVPAVGWFFYETVACFYLPGDGSATRQGPGALASVAVRRRARHWAGGGEAWIPAGRRRATVVSILVYASAGVADLVLAAVWLFLGIFPSHPAVGGVSGQPGMAAHIQGLVVGMYVVNIVTLPIASRVGFIVEDSRPDVPEDSRMASDLAQ